MKNNKINKIGLLWMIISFFIIVFLAAKYYKNENKKYINTYKIDSTSDLTIDVSKLYINRGIIWLNDKYIIENYNTKASTFDFLHPFDFDQKFLLEKRKNSDTVFFKTPTKEVYIILDR